MIYDVFVRKNTKTILVIILIPVLTALILTGVFFLRTPVNAVISAEEGNLLPKQLTTPLFSRYRTHVTIYPEVKEGMKHLYSPLAALQAEEAGDVAPDSACWGLSASDSFSLVFMPDRAGRWLAAVDADKKLNTALIYNSESSDERAVAAIMPSSVILIPYEGYVSFVGAEEIRNTLDGKGVGTIIIPNPSNTVSLLEITPDLALVVSTYYKYAIETGGPAFVVSEDFDAMINSLLEGKEGRVETPYVLSAGKK